MTIESRIQQNIALLTSRVAACAERYDRNPSDLALIAVSKKQPVEVIRFAVNAGIKHIGENKVQEGRQKLAMLQNDPIYSDFSRHFIGPLQTNKIKDAVYWFDLLHSIEKQKQLEMVEKYAAQAGKIMPVMIQVDLSDEPTKHGIEPEQLSELLKVSAKLKSVHICGLMTIAPFEASTSGEKERVRPVFRELVRLRDRARDESGLALECLSMGMSSDWEVAIEEGANHIRIGTAIFGERPQQVKV